MQSAETWFAFDGISLHSEVSLLTPSCSPGVLQHPVVLALLSSVYHEEDSVVERGSAEEMHDSSVVELEEDSLGIDGDGNWSLGNSSLEGSWGLGGDVLEGCGGNSSTFGVTGSSSSSVWVLRLSLHLSRLGIFEGIVHETTIAAHVSFGLGAVDKLLLGEGCE